MQALAAVFALSAGALLIQGGNRLTSVLSAGNEIKYGDRNVLSGHKKMPRNTQINEKLSHRRTIQKNGGYSVIVAGLFTVFGLYAFLPLVSLRTGCLPGQSQFRKMFLHDIKAACPAEKKNVEAPPKTTARSKVIEFANFDLYAYDLSAFQRTAYEKPDYNYMYGAPTEYTYDPTTEYTYGGTTEYTYTAPPTDGQTRNQEHSEKH